MESISGYPYDILKTQIFDQLDKFTSTFINQKVAYFRDRLNAVKEQVFIPFGENCGPAHKAHAAGLQTLGSNYFDNLVAPIESIIQLLDADFKDVLSLTSLSIGS